MNFEFVYFICSLILKDNQRNKVEKARRNKTNGLMTLKSGKQSDA